MVGLVWGVTLALLVSPVASELLWTPILPASQDQVDLWTVSGSGCGCGGEGDGARGKECACCVNRVACPCGAANPHRCAQCGLQQHCNNMCNVTIDGALLSVTSGRKSGSLVPPGDRSPPLWCWYVLRAPPGHRVEVQLHRLVHVGHSINGTACRGGYVEVSDGRTAGVGVGVRARTPHEAALNTIRICGEDQRLHPPAVLFSDSGFATIIYRVNERRGSPRFIAYYNFPAKSDASTGVLQRGGTQVEYTACDWLYQDVHCLREGSCTLTSPGYPGLYPPNARCRYLLVMSSPATSGTLTFASMDLPPERCATDYLAVYSGTSTSSPLITTLCGSDTRTIRFKGPNVLVDFSSGVSLPPYKFSGFQASLEFTDGLGRPPSPGLPTPPPPPDHVMRDPTGGGGAEAGCSQVIRSNVTRSGNFDTSALSPHSHHCWLRFVGQQDEVVQVSFYKYKLEGKACSSTVSIYDGAAGGAGDSLLRKVCGPVSREPRDSRGAFVQPEFLLSSGNLLEIHLRLGPDTKVDTQFLVGAYLFHNARLEGTKKPNSVCDVMFYGADSPARGTVHSPPMALMWNVEGALTCSFLFVPTANQSLSLTVREAGGWPAEGQCVTSCGEEGCSCRPSTGRLSDVDHLLFVHTKSQQIIACLCGPLKDMTQLSLTASGGVDVSYHVGHFSWATPGFNFSLSYSFPPPTLCGPRYYATPVGELIPRETQVPTPAHLYVTCQWVVAGQPGTSLVLTVTPTRHGSCNTWNLTVVALSRGPGSRHVGGRCGSDNTAEFRLPPRNEAAAITLELRGRGDRDWGVTWTTHRTGTLPGAPASSVSPKPESSRTLHANPTGKTYSVRSGGARDHNTTAARTLLVWLVATSLGWQLT